MTPIGNYSESRTSFSNGGDHRHHHHHHHVLGFSGLIEVEGGGGSNTSSSRISSMSTEKSMSASKSHSEAERRRRERINAHLATLRSLLPNTTKTDKASLLAEVVQHVKQLKKLVNDASAKGEDDGCTGDQWPFPGETDELTLRYCDESDEEWSSSSSSKRVLIRVTVSCEDRPGLVSDLTRALRMVQARVVRAEMATVGGRTKSTLLIQGRGNGDDDGDHELLGALRRAFKAILDKPAVSGRGQVVSGNKRPRLSHSHCYST